MASDEIWQWADLTWKPRSQAVGTVRLAPLWNPRMERRKWFVDHFKKWEI